MLGIDTVREHRRPPRRPVGPRRSCARPRRRTSTCSARARGAGVRAAFLTSAGTAKPATRAARAEAELVALADELGMLLAGPNGQGVVSTPAQLCAQIVAPYPPRGPDRDREPVGQLRLVVRELGRADRRRREPRGVGRERGRGRRSPTTSTGTRDDAATAVSLAYVEGVADGRALFERLAARRGAQAGRARQGRDDRAADSARPRATPGSLASDDRVFDGHVPPGRHHARGDDRRGVRSGGHLRDAAAARGAPHVAVLTTAGGWGVVTADAIARDRHARARAAARRPPRRDRREAAAALEPQQPDRPRGRRDARHDPRGDGARRAPSRHRRDRVPRPRDPVEPGAR